MLKKLAPKQRAMVRDGSPHVAALCPRRAGKTFAASLAALITGESKPGSISVIISLNLKQLRRLYWNGGPSGLFNLAKQFGLNLKFHNTHLMWTHENGSIGYLLGTDDEEQLEAIRGLEADLYVIDECKSFPVAKLAKLIDDIIDPQRSSRKGKLLMIGTPGFIAAGPFYQATCAKALDRDGRPFLIPYGEKDPWGRDATADLLWSFHHWSLEDNTAMPHQWTEALIKKRSKGWADDHPTWRREYLGQWTASGDGTVFRYGAEKGGGRVTWTPQVTDENPTGLPEEGAPWRLIAGMDIGFEAPTAFVLCAYSQKLRQLRHVWDYSKNHMLVPDLARLILATQERFGNIEKIYADTGNLGKMVIETLIRDYGFPIEKADKREKLDYIELLNAAFCEGEVLIVEGTGSETEYVLEGQLLTNAWDLGDEDKEELARLGKLREDKSIPNDSTDALLYLYRGSLHYFQQSPPDQAPPYGTPEWVRAWEREQLAKARRTEVHKSDARMGSNRFDSAPRFVKAALKDRWNSLPTMSRRS